MKVFGGRVARWLARQGLGIEREVLGRINASVIAGLSFVVGLAWNDAIKTFIEFIFPLRQDTIFAKFTYATLITIVVVIISIYLVKFVHRKK